MTYGKKCDLTIKKGRLGLDMVLEITQSIEEFEEDIKKLNEGKKNAKNMGLNRGKKSL